MRKYAATVHFTDKRIKPRTIVVETETKSVARRTARSIVAELHPRWTVSQVTAVTTTSDAEPCPGVEQPVVEAPAPRQADPLKKAAAEVASMLHPRGSSAWWSTYKAERSRQQAEIALDVETAVEGVFDALIPA